MYPDVPNLIILLLNSRTSYVIMWELGLGVFELTGRISAFDQGNIFYKQSVFRSRTSISTWLNTVMPSVIFGCYLAVRPPRYIIGQEQNLILKTLIMFSSSCSVVSLEYTPEKFIVYVEFTC